MLPLFSSSVTYSKCVIELNHVVVNNKLWVTWRTSQTNHHNDYIHLRITYWCDICENKLLSSFFIKTQIYQYNVLYVKLHRIEKFFQAVLQCVLQTFLMRIYS